MKDVLSNLNDKEGVIQNIAVSVSVDMKLQQDE